jgi:uncharacterized protein YndB with AHSA1/START domain
MRIALWVLGALGATAVVIMVIGWMLPVAHRAARQATFQAPAARLYALITSPNDFPAWRTGVKLVEVLPDENGHGRFREVSGDGTITYEVAEAVPDRRVVTRIADPNLPFGGAWTYELLPTKGGGTTLRIIEDGEVYNPLFRFVSRYVMGHEATMDRYLRDVAKKLGETPVIESVPGAARAS